MASWPTHTGEDEEQAARGARAANGSCGSTSASPLAAGACSSPPSGSRERRHPGTAPSSKQLSPAVVRGGRPPPVRSNPRPIEGSCGARRAATPSATPPVAPPLGSQSPAGNSSSGGSHVCVRQMVPRAGSSTDSPSLSVAAGRAGLPLARRRGRTVTEPPLPAVPAPPVSAWERPMERPSPNACQWPSPHSPRSSASPSIPAQLTPSQASPRSEIQRKEAVGKEKVGTEGGEEGRLPAAVCAMGHDRGERREPGRERAVVEGSGSEAGRKPRVQGVRRGGRPESRRAETLAARALAAREAAAAAAVAAAVAADGTVREARVGETNGHRVADACSLRRDALARDACQTRGSEGGSPTGDRSAARRDGLTGGGGGLTRGWGGCNHHVCNWVERTGPALLQGILYEDP